jgi:hypothetical protein
MSDDTAQKAGNYAMVRGDTRALPDRGTSAGVEDTYGADLSQNATNPCGSLAGRCNSDPAERSTPHG